MRDLNGVPVRMIGVNFDITDRKRSEDARELLLRELDHRVKNLFAMISALIGLSARHCETPQQLVASLRDRLSALSSSLLKNLESGAFSVFLLGLRVGRSGCVRLLATVSRVVSGRVLRRQQFGNSDQIV